MTQFGRFIAYLLFWPFQVAMPGVLLVMWLFGRDEYFSYYKFLGDIKRPGFSDDDLRKAGFEKINQSWERQVNGWFVSVQGNEPDKRVQLTRPNTPVITVEPRHIYDLKILMRQL